MNPLNEAFAWAQKDKDLEVDDLAIMLHEINTIRSFISKKSPRYQFYCNLHHLVNQEIQKRLHNEETK